MLADATAAVHYSAALLGVVTRAANNFSETTWRGDGSAVVVKRRDALPLPFDDRRRHQAMRRADAAPRATGDKTKPEDKPLPATASTTSSPPAGGTAPADHGRAQAAALRQRHHEAQQRGVQAWVQDLAHRGLQPAHNAGQAAQRLAALRERIVAKQSMR